MGKSMCVWRGRLHQSVKRENEKGMSRYMTTQTRTANSQNEITGISGLTTSTFDNNGNMTRDESGQRLKR